jgi:predicted transcriptional regulator
MMAAHLPHGLEVARLGDIQAAVARGKADVEAGRTMDAAEAFAELEAYFRVIARGAASTPSPITDDGRA